MEISAIGSVIDFTLILEPYKVSFLIFSEVLSFKNNKNSKAIVIFLGE